MNQVVQLTAFIEREDDGYVSTCPVLDIVSQGDTVEQARMNLLEAAEGFFETASQSEIQRRFRKNWGARKRNCCICDLGRTANGNILVNLESEQMELEISFSRY